MTNMSHSSWLASVLNDIVKFLQFLNSEISKLQILVAGHITKEM